MSPAPTTRKAAASSAKSKKKEGFRSPGAKEVEGNAAVLAAIARMPEPWRSMGGRLHTLIVATAPSLAPRTWYGAPAYTGADGYVLVYFRGGDKFKERYMTLAFNDTAQLDDGQMWPISFALSSLTPADEARIAGLIQKALG